MMTSAQAFRPRDGAGCCSRVPADCGELHLDALNHDLFTACEPKEDRMGAEVGGGLAMAIA